jgi:integrase
MATQQYSSKTIVQYNTCIATLSRLYNDCDNKEFILPDSLQNSDKILSILLNIYKKPTVINFISAILWKLRQFDTDVSQSIQVDYQKHGKNIKEEMERSLIGKEFELTEKEKKTFMLWEDIQKIYSEISRTVDRTNYNSFMDYVVISLYVLHPPVRADYANMRIFIDESHIEKNIEENYCVLQTNPRFVFQQYKTAKDKGITVVPMDNELHNILLDWIEINPSDYLLSSYVISKKIYKPFTETTLCKRITAIFLKYSDTPVTINTLRHSFISFMSRYDQEYDKKRANADKMMHSMAMADKYRRMVYIQ